MPETGEEQLAVVVGRAIARHRSASGLTQEQVTELRLRDVVGLGENLHGRRRSWRAWHGPQLSRLAYLRGGWRNHLLRWRFSGHGRRGHGLPRAPGRRQS